MSSGGEAPRFTGVQAVVGSRRPGLGGYMDGGLVGGPVGVGGGDGRYRDKDVQLIRWEDTVAN